MLAALAQYSRGFPVSYLFPHEIFLVKEYKLLFTSHVFNAQYGRDKLHSVPHLGLYTYQISAVLLWKFSV